MTNLYDPLSLFSGLSLSLPGFGFESLISILFRVLVFVLLVMYAFFALFLYLRVRILSLTMHTPFSGFVGALSLFHLVAVVGFVIFTSLLLLF